MNASRGKRLLAIGVAAIALAACGGGSGTNVASTPRPPTSPPVTSTPTPTPTPVATFNASIFTPAPAEPLVSVTAKQPASFDIRYDPVTATYAVSEAGGDWKVLKTFDDVPGRMSMAFDGGSLNIRQSLESSAMGHISSVERNDLFAFGASTPTSAVPVTGSATYQGWIMGRTDIVRVIGSSDYSPWIEGTVNLSFDFDAGILAGSMHPVLYESDGWDASVGKDLGNIALVNTAFGAGSTSFSGRFDTALAGANEFSGYFTGPAAQELIGRWALPFTYASPSDPPGTSDLHNAWGVMIGKR